MCVWGGGAIAVLRGLFSWSKDGLFWVLVNASAPESRSAMLLGPLEFSDSRKLTSIYPLQETFI